MGSCDERLVHDTMSCIKPRDREGVLGPGGGSGTGNGGPGTGRGCGTGRRCWDREEVLGPVEAPGTLEWLPGAGRGPGTREGPGRGSWDRERLLGSLGPGRGSWYRERLLEPGRLTEPGRLHGTRKVVIGSGRLVPGRGPDPVRGSQTRGEGNPLGLGEGLGVVRASMWIRGLLGEFINNFQLLSIHSDGWFILLILTIYMTKYLFI